MSRKSDKKVRDEVVEHVQVQERLESAHARATGGIRQRISVLEQRLDQIVMDLYGISENERILLEKTLNAVPVTTDFPEEIGPAARAVLRKAVPAGQRFREIAWAARQKCRHARSALKGRGYFFPP